jgi:hypothetical protein
VLQLSGLLHSIVTLHLAGGTKLLQVCMRHGRYLLVQLLMTKPGLCKCSLAAQRDLPPASCAWSMTICTQGAQICRKGVRAASCSPAPSVARRLDLGASTLDQPEPEVAPASTTAAAPAAFTAVASPAAAAAACPVQKASADARCSQVGAEGMPGSAETVCAPATPELSAFSLALPFSSSSADSALSSALAAADLAAATSADSPTNLPTPAAHATLGQGGAAAQPLAEAAAPDCSAPSDLEASPLQGAPPAPQLGYLAAALRARAAAAADIAGVLLVSSNSNAGSSSHLASPIVLAGELTVFTTLATLQFVTIACCCAMRHLSATRALHCCATSLMRSWREWLCQ